MKCTKCSYEWVSIKPKPKSCPRCKTRLDISTPLPQTNSSVEVDSRHNHSTTPNLKVLNAGKDEAEDFDNLDYVIKEDDKK